MGPRTVKPEASAQAVRPSVHGSILLRKWRNKRSLFDVAVELRLDPSLLSKIERCKRDASFDVARTLRDKAGIPIEAWEADEPTTAEIKRVSDAIEAAS